MVALPELAAELGGGVLAGEAFMFAASGTAKEEDGQVARKA